jgi:signal transduction histidine kinase
LIPPDIDVKLEFGKNIGSVYIDVLQIRRVLDNLIGNAIEAMPEGGLLNVSTSRAVEGVTVRIADMGIGMTPEVKANLFKPFYTTKHGGVGLGLAYCKRAVDAHGGTITVDSNVGEGTVFTIQLPDQPTMPTPQDLAAQVDVLVQASSTESRL